MKHLSQSTIGGFRRRSVVILVKRSNNSLFIAIPLS
jgi:hypothetical protein